MTAAKHRAGRTPACRRRLESSKLSTDALFIEKLRDVVALYLNPPENALALCVHEKSPCQALERTQPMLCHA